MTGDELDHEQFKQLVESRQDEALAILYVLACERLAACKIDSASAEADLINIKARIYYLETVLDCRRKKLLADEAAKYAK